MGLVFAFLGLQALALLLLKWGLKLEGRVFWGIVLVFVIFCLPLPYLAFLISHARQPGSLTAALIVRPVFAWQFNWLGFLLLLGPLVIVLRVLGIITGWEWMVTLLRWLMGSIACFWGLVSIYGLAATIKPPEVTTHELIIPGLAKKDDGLRLVQLADPHLSWWTSRQEAQEIIDTIKGLKPELLVLTGDLVDQNPDYADSLGEYLKQVQPRLGKFGIIGNHDVYTGREEIAQKMEASGIRMLRRGWVSLEDKGVGLLLGGMDDSGIGWTGPDPWEKQIPEIVKSCPPGLPLIWLGHRPTSFDKVLGLPVALTLSGHTHGGQLRIPFGGPGLADLGFARSAGLYRVGDQVLYVSRGTGTVGWPFRIACPEEIALFILRAP